MASNQQTNSAIENDGQNMATLKRNVPEDDYSAFQSRLAAWELARFAPPPEPPLTPLEPTLIKMMPLRDGAELYTEIFLPTEEGLIQSEDQGFPIILIRSPYPFSLASRSGGLTIPRYLDAGYGLVYQLTRGQGESKGSFQFLRDDINDGYDAVQWLAGQPWCNSKVGMMGSSYLGSTQLLAARVKPPALKCIMPTAFIGHFTRCFPFSCGVPAKGIYMQWHQVLDASNPSDLDVAYNDMRALQHPKWGPAFRKRPLIDAADQVLSGDKLTSWRETLSNPTDQDYWAPLHFTDAELAELDLPIFFTDGWYDATVGPVDFFSRLEKATPGREDRYLLVGPWDHYQTAANSQAGDDNGDRILPDNGAMDFIAQRLAFFDRYLKGDKTSKVQEDRVRVYISGAPDSKANCWLKLPTFPAPDTNYQSFYLHSQGDARSYPGDGLLSAEPPGQEPNDHYTYDPALPTHSQMETYCDRRDVEIRSDVLTYTSAPLKQALTILGDIQLVLYAASDGPDTDWFTVITEVFPGGQSKSFHYAPQAFRARYREGLDKEVFLIPNQPEKFQIPMGSAGHQIAAGNRLRLSIFSSAFPEYDTNANTGNPAATDTEIRVAQQTILHNIERPSRLILPVIELAPS